MLPRAAAEATLALLLGGALATRGFTALLPSWGWAVPFLVCFLILELALRGREKGASRVFRLGAAFALLYEGVYAKTLLDGLGVLGVDLGALASAFFDWGMLSVMACHLVSRRFPRRSPGEEEGRLSALPAAGTLLFLGVCMAAVYAVKTYFGHYVVERMLGPAWLLTDLLFAGAAGLLLRSALRADPAEPPPWLYVLCAFAVWSPATQAALSWSEEFSWPASLTWTLGLVWTAAVAWGFWRLWRWRGAVDENLVKDSPLILYAAGWRVAGSVAVLLAYHPAVFDERAAAAYAALIDMPSRLVFSYALLTARLDV